MFRGPRAKDLSSARDIAWVGESFGQGRPCGPWYRREMPPNCLRNGPRVPRHLPRDSRFQHTKAAVWSAHCNLIAWHCNMANTNQYIEGSLRNRRIVFPSRDAPWNRNRIHARNGNGRLHPALMAAPGEGALPRQPEAAYHRRLRWLQREPGPVAGSRTAEARTRTRHRDQRVPPAARDQQMEPCSAQATFFLQPELARQIPVQPHDHHRPDRLHQDRNGAEGLLRQGHERLSDRYQVQQIGDGRPGYPARRLPW